MVRDGAELVTFVSPVPSINGTPGWAPPSRYGGKRNRQTQIPAVPVFIYAFNLHDL